MFWRLSVYIHMFTMYGDYSHMMWLLHNIKTMQIYKFTHNPVLLLFVHNLTECQGGLLLTGMINLSISQWLPGPLVILEFCLGWQSCSILLNLCGSTLFDQLIDIARLIEMRVQEGVRVCIIQSSRSRITHILPFTLSFSIQ